MTHGRKTPERTCIACRTTSDKRTFVRIARTPEGYVLVDATGRMNGRGAYLCARQSCMDEAVSRRRLDPALRVQLKDDDIDRLRREFASAISACEVSPQGR